VENQNQVTPTKDSKQARATEQILSLQAKPQGEGDFPFTRTADTNRELEFQS
jgi:hypothetical protein